MHIILNKKYEIKAFVKHEVGCRVAGDLTYSVVYEMKIDDLLRYTLLGSISI